MCGKYKTDLLKSLLLLSVCFCFLPACACYAGEVTSMVNTLPQEMTITAREYSRLVNNLNELSEINTTSQQELAALREQSINLSQKLEILKKNSAEQEKSLQIANEYLRKSKQEQLRVKWQRNIAWGILGFVLVSNLK